MQILSVTTTPSAWTISSSLVPNSTRVWTSLGLHPQLAHQRKHELALFESLLEATKYVGEIGLDGSPEFKTYWADQIAVFDRILDLCALAGGRVLSIHSRRATSDVLDRLENKPQAGTPILHWFSGSHDDLFRALDLDCWFSVGPAMLASKKGRDLVQKIPVDRIITETDGPFAQLNGQSLFPWDVSVAVSELAKLWKEPYHSIELHLSRNLECLRRD